MTYTIFTLFTASIQVAIICIFLNYWLKKRIANVQCLSGILFFAAISPYVRLILPMEFYFTYEIKSDHVYPMIYDFFKADFLFLSITRMQFIYILWAIVSISIISIKIINHLQFVKCFSLIPSSHSEYSEILCGLNFYNTNKIKIKKTSIISEPMVFGLLRPTILLPNNNDLNEHDLYFILKHELAHLYHHDLLIKWLLEILCSLYWWIPPLGKLKAYVYFIMEIRADDFVIKDHQNDVRREYLSSLLKVCTSRNLNPILATPFCYYGNASRLKQRFNKISNFSDDKKAIKQNSLLVATLCACILILSYFIVIQPDYKDTRIDGKSFDITEDMYYLIPNDDGGYGLHIDGQFIANIDDLDDELEKLPVLNFGG